MAHEVIGRELERPAIDRVLGSAAQGLSILLFEGEAGIGKTTLWEAARTAAVERRFEVLSSRPAPSEAGLPLGGFGDSSTMRWSLSGRGRTCHSDGVLRRLVHELATNPDQHPSNCGSRL